MKKRTLTVFVCLLLAVVLTVSAFAAGASVAYSTVNLSFNGEKVGNSGEYYELSNGASAPYSISYVDEKGGSTTYLPVRKLTELLGIGIDWNGSTKTVEITDGKPAEANDDRIKLNANYGPLTIVDYNSSGKFDYQIQLDSLILTKVETNSYAGLYFALKGVTTQSSGYSQIKVNFYDANDTAIGQGVLMFQAAANTQFNLNQDSYIDKDIFEKAVYMRFTSDSGAPAVKGIQDFSKTDITDVTTSEKEQTKLSLPEVPYVLKNYSYGDELQSTFTITDISYTVTGTTLYLSFAGNKTADTRGNGQSDTCKISWKLYDSDGYVVDTGTCYSPSCAVGDKFKDVKDTIYNITVGESYRLEILNTN